MDQPWHEDGVSSVIYNVNILSLCSVRNGMGAAKVGLKSRVSVLITALNIYYVLRSLPRGAFEGKTYFSNFHSCFVLSCSDAHMPSMYANEFGD